jgi:hypothetical protein
MSLPPEGRRVRNRRDEVRLSPEGRRARARIAALKRHHGPNVDVADEAAQIERDRLDQHIDELIARAPQMTPEQRDRLSRLFKYGSAPEGAAAG